VLSHTEQVVSECAISFLLTKGCSFAARKKKLSRYMPSWHRRDIEVQLYLFSTPTLKGGGWLATRAYHLTPGKKHRIPITHEVVWPRGSSGWVRKISPHQGSNPGPSSPQRVAIPTTLSLPPNRGRQMPGEYLQLDQHLPFPHPAHFISLFTCNKPSQLQSHKL
jgi:hypothetical protein